MTENYIENQLKFSADEISRYRKIISKLDSADPKYHYPFNFDQVLNMEREIGYRLPKFYVYLLTDISVPEFYLKDRENSCDIIPLLLWCNEFLSKQSKVSLTEFERFYIEPYNFPRYIFPFSYSFQSTEPYCFDLSQMKNGDCPVYRFDLYDDFWNAPKTGDRVIDDRGVDIGNYPDKMSDSFEEFMTMYVEKRLEF